MRGWTIGAATALVIMAGAASADPRDYVQAAIGDWLVVCHPSGDMTGLGGVCWPGGHIQPNFGGQATLIIVDNLITPTSGFYCQDLNADHICGSGDVLARQDTLTATDFDIRLRGQGTIHSEPAVHFCAAVLLDSPLSPVPRSKAAWAAGNNWDPNVAVHVFIDGPVNGGPLANPCGTLYSGGVNGFVTHT